MNWTKSFFTTVRPIFSEICIIIKLFYKNTIFRNQQNNIKNSKKYFINNFIILLEKIDVYNV